MSEKSEARAELMEILIEKIQEIRVVIDRFLARTGEKADLCDILLDVGADNEEYISTTIWERNTKYDVLCFYKTEKCTTDKTDDMNNFTERKETQNGQAV